MLKIDTHKTILLQILKEIYSNTALGPVLGFKGGTAAYLFYDLDRFSTDLDFDLLDEKKEDYVFDEIEKILREYGQIKEKYKKKNTLFFIISYSQKAQNIKVEISRRNFGSDYQLMNYLGISMLVMTKEDIFAHKLVTLMERKKTASRDLYDIWFFLRNNWDINQKILEKRTKMNLKDYLNKCVKFIDDFFNDKNILDGIGELLDAEQKTWAKANLKKDILFLLKVKLDEY